MSESSKPQSEPDKLSKSKTTPAAPCQLCAYRHDILKLIVRTVGKGELPTGSALVLLQNLLSMTPDNHHSFADLCGSTICELDDIQKLEQKELEKMRMTTYVR